MLVSEKLLQTSFRVVSPPTKNQIRFPSALPYHDLSGSCQTAMVPTQRTSEPSGIDILVAVDVSKSILARDPVPNRLERVKLSMTNLMEKVRGDRLGLIAFSGSAFLQCPLTLDHQAFVKTLDDLTIGLIKQPGTNLSKPIDEASRSFSKDDSDRLILLSDGEDLVKALREQSRQLKREFVFSQSVSAPQQVLPFP